MSTLTIYLTDHGRVGHAYLGLTDDNGHTEYRGYYPSDSTDKVQEYANKFYGNGELKDDQHSFDEGRSTASARLDLTEQQAHDLKEYIDAVEKNPGDYILLNSNCVDFVNSALQKVEPDFDIGNLFTAKELTDNNFAGLYASAKYGEHHLADESNSAQHIDHLPGKADWATGWDMEHDDREPDVSVQPEAPAAAHSSIEPVTELFSPDNFLPPDHLQETIDRIGSMASPTTYLEESAPAETYTIPEAASNLLETLPASSGLIINPVDDGGLYEAGPDNEMRSPVMAQAEPSFDMSGMPATGSMAYIPLDENSLIHVEPAIEVPLSIDNGGSTTAPEMPQDHFWETPAPAVPAPDNYGPADTEGTPANNWESFLETGTMANQTSEPNPVSENSFVADAGSAYGELTETFPAYDNWNSDPTPGNYIMEPVAAPDLGNAPAGDISQASGQDNYSPDYASSWADSYSDPGSSET